MEVINVFRDAAPGCDNDDVMTAEDPDLNPADECLPTPLRRRLFNTPTAYADSAVIENVQPGELLWIVVDMEENYGGCGLMTTPYTYATRTLNLCCSASTLAAGNECDPDFGTSGQQCVEGWTAASPPPPSPPPAPPPATWSFCRPSSLCGVYFSVRHHAAVRPS